MCHHALSVFLLSSHACIPTSCATHKNEIILFSFLLFSVLDGIQALPRALPLSHAPIHILICEYDFKRGRGRWILESLSHTHVNFSPLTSAP